MIYGEYVVSRKLYDSVKKAINNLKMTPYRFTPIKFAKLKNIAEYRKCIVGKYIIFYSINKKNDSVYVERFIHCTRDWMRML